MTKTSTVQTFWTTIYCGLKGTSGKTFSMNTARKLCEEYAKHGVPMTLTQTEFIDEHGRQPGIIVEISNRVGTLKRATIIDHAQKLAMILKEHLKQEQVIIVHPSGTIIIEDAKRAA